MSGRTAEQENQLPNLTQQRQSATAKPQTPEITNNQQGNPS